MATQQQFPMDPNTPLGQLWARNGGRKRQKDQSLSLQSSTMQREQLRAYAHMEARSWEVVESKERAVALETKWKKAKETIETRNRILREAAGAGHSLNQEAKTLTDTIALLRETMQEVKAALREAKQLPHVEALGFRCVPRAFASVSSYFRAMNYEFNEQTFEQFFSAAQEIKALEMDELWQLRPFAELVLLEAVAERADELENSPYAGREERQGEDESARGATTDVQTLAASLRTMADVDWKELLERINVIEQILRKDPCGAYPQMDYESRESYRKTITEMAERSKASEQSIAQAAMGFANAGRIFPTFWRLRWSRFCWSQGRCWGLACRCLALRWWRSCCCPRPNARWRLSTRSRPLWFPQRFCLNWTLQKAFLPTTPQSSRCPRC